MRRGDLVLKNVVPFPERKISLPANPLEIGFQTNSDNDYNFLIG